MAVGDDINKLGKSATQTLNSLDQIAASAKAKANELEDESAKLVESTISRSKKLAQMMTGVNADTVKSLKEQKKIRDAAAESQREITKLERQGFYFLQKALTASEDQAKVYRKLSEDYYNAADNLSRTADAARDLVDSFDKLNTSTEFFRSMADLVGDIPVLRKLFSEFEQAALASEKAGGGGKGFLAGLEKLTGTGAKTFMGLLVAAVTRFDQLNVDVARNLAASGKSAKDIEDSIKNSGFLFREAKESVQGFAQAIGTSGSITRELAGDVTLLQSRLGLSADAATSLYSVSTLTGKTLKETTSTLVGTTEVLNTLNERTISFKDIMNGITEASELTRLSISKFDGGLAKAAFTTRKLGLSFSLLEGSSSKLLDFESSISAELEAELVTGKQLNLQRARELAMQGDLAGLAEEITKNVATEEEFLRMNVYQREMLARAVGMTAQELAKSFDIQRRDAAVADLLNDATFKKLNLEKQIVALRAKGYSEQEAMNQLVEKGGVDIVEKLTKQLTVTEHIEKITDDFLNQKQGTIGGLLDNVNWLLEGIRKNVGLITTGLGLMFAGSVIKAGYSFYKLIRGIGFSMKGIASSSQSMTGGGINTNIPGFGGGSKGAKGFAGLFKGKNALKFLKGGGRLLGKAFLPLTLLMGAADALQGFSADSGASIGEKLKNAGSSLIDGLTFGLLGKSPEEIKAAASASLDTNLKPEESKANRITSSETKGKTAVELLEMIHDAIVNDKHVYIDGRRVDEVVRMNRINQ